MTSRSMHISMKDLRRCFKKFQELEGESNDDGNNFLAYT